MNHTPTPWKTVEFEDEGTGIEGNQCPVGLIVSPDDAAFIVTACNSHEALVKALETGLSQLRTVTYNHPDDEINNAVLKQMRAALALAKGVE
jgi:hypothetical protein